MSMGAFEMEIRHPSIPDKLQDALERRHLTYTKRYLGVRQDLHDAPCDYLKLDLSGQGDSGLR
jgi:hypothetical protein